MSTRPSIFEIFSFYLNDYFKFLRCVLKYEYRLVFWFFVIILSLACSVLVWSVGDIVTFFRDYSGEGLQIIVFLALFVPVFGVILYALFGGLFFLVVAISRGYLNVPKSAKIFLYSISPLNWSVLTVKIIDYFLPLGESFSLQINLLIASLMFSVFLFGFYYSLKFFQIGAVKFLGIDRVESTFSFLIIPILLVLIYSFLKVKGAV